MAIVRSIGVIVAPRDRPFVEEATDCRDRLAICAPPASLDPSAANLASNLPDRLLWLLFVAVVAVVVACHIDSLVDELGNKWPIGARATGALI